MTLARGSDLPESEAVTDWEASINKDARTLGRLLGLLPSLTKITGHVGEDACIEEILGRALLIARAPNNLTVFELHADVKYFRDARSLKWGPLFRPRFLSLMKALFLGRFSMLETPRLREGVCYLKEETNSELFINAMAAGQLSRIRQLRVEGGLHVDVLVRAFGRSLEGGRQQVFLEEFVMDPATSREQHGSKPGYFGHLPQLLRLTPFIRLKSLAILAGPWSKAAIREQIEILASYIEHTEGAPCIEEIQVRLDRSDPGFHRLNTPLMEGKVPNLRRLTIHNASGPTFQQLGVIYRMNGLDKLIELHFERPAFDEASMRAWMDGVKSADHAGAALEVLAFHKEVVTPTPNGRGVKCRFKPGTNCRFKRVPGGPQRRCISQFADS